MISPELLRRFPFFAYLDDAQLRELAMMAEEVRFDDEVVLFEAESPADALYLLLEGVVEMHYVVIDRDDPKIRKDFYVGEVDPGEIFGMSALIPPYKMTLTAIADEPCKVVKVQAERLRELCDADAVVGYRMMRGLARTALDRLDRTRVQLAAARN